MGPACLGFEYGLWVGGGFFFRNRQLMGGRESFGQVLVIIFNDCWWG